MSPWQDHKLLKACGFRRLACLVIIASRLHGVGDKQGSGADTGLHYPGLLSSGAVDAIDNLDVARDVMQASNPSSMSTPPESVAVVWSLQVQKGSACMCSSNDSLCWVLPKPWDLVCKTAGSHLQATMLPGSDTACALDTCTTMQAWSTGLLYIISEASACTISTSNNLGWPLDIVMEWCGEHCKKPSAGSVPCAVLKSSRRVTKRVAWSVSWYSQKPSAGVPHVH